MKSSRFSFFYVLKGLFIWIEQELIMGETALTKM